MARARLIKTSDGIEKHLNAFIERGKTIQAYLNRVTYRQYQQAQIKRWETENTSETGKWPSLNPKYEARKKVRFAEFPGGGRAMMVATGRLAAAAQGRGEGALKLFAGNRIVVGIDDSAIPYGKYAAEARPFMIFGEETTKTIMNGLTHYLTKGEE